MNPLRPAHVADDHDLRKALFKRAMKIWGRCIAVLAACAAAPLVGWLIAVLMSQHGASEIEATVSMIGSEAQISVRLYGQAASVSFWTGVGVTIAAATFGACGLWWFSSRRRIGTIVAHVTLAIAAATYGWMVWDEPAPEPIASIRLIPDASVMRAPRELILEATKDALHGRSESWPDPEITRIEDEPSAEWLSEHAAEIRSDWEQLQPVHDWVRRVNAYPGFDDYFNSFSAPVLNLQPLRQYDFGSRRLALLLASEGRSDDAIALLTELFTFARKLGEGARNLVTLMIGAVFEKDALETLAAARSRGILSATEGDALFRLLQQPAPDSQNLERVLLNDLAWAQRTFCGNAEALQGIEPWILRMAFALEFNRNATATQIQADYSAFCQMEKNQDFASIDHWALAMTVRKGQLRFKNWTGQLLRENYVPPDLPKIARTLNSLRELRANLARDLGNQPLP